MSSTQLMVGPAKDGCGWGTILIGTNRGETCHTPDGLRHHDWTHGTTIPRRENSR